MPLLLGMPVCRRQLHCIGPVTPAASPSALWLLIPWLVLPCLLGAWPTSNRIPSLLAPWPLTLLTSCDSLPALRLRPPLLLLLLQRLMLLRAARDIGIREGAWFATEGSLHHALRPLLCGLLPWCVHRAGCNILAGPHGPLLLLLLLLCVHGSVPRHDKLPASPLYRWAGTGSTCCPLLSMASPCPCRAPCLSYTHCYLCPLAAWQATATGRQPTRPPCCELLMLMLLLVVLPAIWAWCGGAPVLRPGLALPRLGPSACHVWGREGACAHCIMPLLVCICKPLLLLLLLPGPAC